MKLKDQMISRKHSGKFSSFVVYLHASAMTWAFLCVAANQMWHDTYCFMDCFIQSMYKVSIFTQVNIRNPTL